jgi:hypothetical protein
MNVAVGFSPPAPIGQCTPKIEMTRYQLVNALYESTPEVIAILSPEASIDR